MSDQQKQAIVEISDDLCKGCEICIAFCPLNVFASSDSLNQRGYYVPKVVDAEACSACRLCELLCPEFAIFVDKDKVKSSK